MFMYAAAYSMVLGLPPKAIKKGRFHSSSAAVSTSDTTMSSVKQPPMASSASSVRFCPMKMEARGAPPPPTRAAKAATIRMMGIQRPTPVKARSPSRGIRPI